MNAQTVPFTDHGTTQQSANDDGPSIAVAADAVGTSLGQLAGSRPAEVLPGGRRIGFSTKEEGADRGTLRVMDSDGSNVTRVGEVETFFARWSPDGSKIAFITGRWPTTEIHPMAGDGSRP